MFSKELIEKLLPPIRRKSRQIAWLFRLHLIARGIFEQFDAFRVRVNECLLYSSQTLSLQAYLQLKFNSNGIFIVNDFSGIEPIFIYWLFENQEQTTIYYFSEGEENPTIHYLSEEAQSQLNHDFIVQVPAILSPQEDQIKAMINKLKLAGKRYKIEYY